MLTDNYIIYYGYIIFGAMMFGTLGRVFSEILFGLTQPVGLKLCKTDKSRKMFMNVRRVLALLIVVFVFLIPFALLFFPVYQDIPEYLSGNYSVAEGTVIRSWTNVEKDASVRGNIEIVEDSTGEIIKFREMYIPYMEKGTHVKIAYLDHCKMGSFLEIDGRNTVGREHSDKLLFFVLAVLINIFMFYYVTHSFGKWEWSSKNKYSVLVYKSICGVILLSMLCIIEMGTLVVMGAFFGNYHSNMVILWTWELLIYIALTLGLFIVKQQKLTIKEEELFYCSFKEKYVGTVGDIVNMQITDKKSYIKENKKSFQLLLTMADGTILVVNDMETASNQKFYERLKSEVLSENVDGSKEEQR